MSTLWRTAFERGGQSWPTVELRYETFCERLAALGHGEGTLPEHVEAIYVCAAGALGENAACRAIEQRHFGALRSAIARVDGRKDFIDEVLQLLRVHVFSGPAPKISSYTGRGPLERWLRTAAMRIAFRQKKAGGRQVESLPDSPDLAAAPTVVSRREDDRDQAFQAAYARAFERALQEAFSELQPRERAVLRLHFAEGMNIDEIGRVYAVHRATVARWIAGYREGLARAIRGRLEAQFGQLAQDEFDSLFGLVYEQLDVSVTALLRNSVQFAGIAAPDLADEKAS
ncbi:MAG TPA: sigma-70 family RNA polymerase sigma factor [Polyangiaceae bacterium]|nr:sigma-70 family RNA polymerase sigma factor [Polyangiaceae bacterium]